VNLGINNARLSTMISKIYYLTGTFCFFIVLPFIYFLHANCPIYPTKRRGEHFTNGERVTDQERIRISETSSPRLAHAQQPHSGPPAKKHIGGSKAIFIVL
jgi:hypothetical protein